MDDPTAFDLTYQKAVLKLAANCLVLFATYTAVGIALFTVGECFLGWELAPLTVALSFVGSIMVVTLGFFLLRSIFGARRLEAAEKWLSGKIGTGLLWLFGAICAAFVLLACAACMFVAYAMFRWAEYWVQR